ncbi:MAG: alpha/beta hydrolase [Leptolyngbya sp. SIO4C1]|nr:alpha/beta hydrolase [Leptolyngbya sp. SIO4C1]
MIPLNPIPEAETSQVSNEEMTEKRIYFISGLGADERVFHLLDYSGYDPVHIRWIPPEPRESIESYAARLCEQIQEHRPTLVGLSFGGLIATEIAKQIEVEQVILVSSAKTAAEIPIYYKLFRILPIHRIFPFKTMLWAAYWLAYWLFGVDTLDERRLLKAILLDTNPQFLKWALHKVVTWRNQTVPERLVHLHGGCDRIFPLRFAQPSCVIDEGGHLMIMNCAIKVSALMRQFIKAAAQPLSPPA